MLSSLAAASGAQRLENRDWRTDNWRTETGEQRLENRELENRVEEQRLENRDWRTENWRMLLPGSSSLGEVAYRAATTGVALTVLPFLGQLGKWRGKHPSG